MSRISAIVCSHTLLYYPLGTLSRLGPTASCCITSYGKAGPPTPTVPEDVGPAPCRTVGNCDLSGSLGWNLWSHRLALLLRPAYLHLSLFLHLEEFCCSASLSSSLKPYSSITSNHNEVPTDLSYRGRPACCPRQRSLRHRERGRQCSARRARQVPHRAEPRRDTMGY